MNSNEKGVKGLIKIIDDLHDKGYYTFIPFDDHSPIDLIALSKTGVTLRLQIKCHSSTNRTINASTVINGKRTPIDRSLLDGWAVYFWDLGKIVYFHKSIMEGKSTHTVNLQRDYGELSSWVAVLDC